MSDQPETNLPQRLSERVGNVHVAHRPEPQRARVVRAKFDAAQTTDENRRHWANADGLSPDAAANAAVRAALRNRCRYEYVNNSYCNGIVHTLATDCVGPTGPRLQMQIEKNEDLNDQIEEDFSAWAEEVGLAETLRTMRAARAHSGEVFGLMGTNKALVSDVKMGVTLVEPDRVTSPWLDLASSIVDGIDYDRNGNPVTYHVLRFHPGGFYFDGLMTASQFDPWPAKYVLHYFRPDRPEQHRGIPDLTPAVQLFAELRRYTNAVIAAAETAADFAAVIQADAPADADGASTEVASMDTVELTRRMATTLPMGWKLDQIKAEQPTTMYADFVDKKLEEIARCLGVPWTIAALNSSKANMSASYLDGQRYANSVSVDRHRLECLLNRLLDVWLTEWIGVNRPRALPPRLARQWFWPSLGHHADPTAIAGAQETRLAIGTTTIPRECAKDGLDWEQEQMAAAKSLGLTVDEYRKLLQQKIFAIKSTGPAPAAGGSNGQPQPKPGTNGQPNRMGQYQ